MLIDLYVKNFAIIEELQLDFSPNLTVISGETGAGKSLTVDALSIVLGGKADASMIYQGRSQGEVIATFDISRIPRAKAWLTDNAIGFDEELCILRRVINSNGRSRGFINGRAMPLQALKNLGERLVDIHGQHAHQSLTRANAQRHLVDQYAGCLDEVNELATFTRNLQDREQKLSDLKNRDESTQDRINFLKFQLAEFNNIAPQEGEWETINTRFNQLNNFEMRISAIEEAIQYLNHDEYGITRQLGQLAQSLQSLENFDPSIKDISEMINNALILSSESENELTGKLDHESFDMEELRQIDSRMQALNSLARKHRIDPENLLQKQQELEQELKSQDVSEEEIAELEAKIAVMRIEWQKMADEISRQRQEAIEELDLKITESMQGLAMEGGQFAIHLQPNTPYHPYGNEAVEFRVSANPGQPLQPLGKVASGGELARISLAISVILSMRSSLPTLIFDEVDTGVGGAVAEMIGRYLQELSIGRQVFCVTHLPQVASFGHHHFVVAKTKGENSTTTAIRSLDEKGRIQEIARMLGGVKLTEATFEHAKEMIEHNRPAA
ncbi:DNA repair protein RecN [Ignatzschineria ureiclastica]|uniref:DNA repair protein RecN n=1 Tax=Ignatzschineria ureiclastica TaxID=472582 RepID=A0A2U2AH43_9GAMM|nr:DNA repair protein RecN [Ignatzschineria ureiclastica]PWD81909.1 DNA repair protein RecN [Ignatzschineria ureiclastica]GGZ91353.1 DNA repair protein RecN [Ignatzschineria ureiclastica]